MKTNLVTLLLIGVIVLSGEAQSKDKETKISKAIEGQWVAVDGTSNGEPAPPGYLNSLVFEFKDGHYRLAPGGASPYTVDDTKQPAWIDIQNSLHQVGIAEIRKGKLRLCFGVNGERPTEFKSKPYTDQTYLVLKRKEPTSNTSTNEASPLH